MLLLIPTIPDAYNFWYDGVDNMMRCSTTNWTISPNKGTSTSLSHHLLVYQQILDLNYQSLTTNYTWHVNQVFHI